MSNWIEFKINEKKYFLLCKINEENEFDSLLYDGNQSWHEKQPLDTIIKRAKEQNKRIQYDEETIKKTLQSAQPTEATWLSENASDKSDEDDLDNIYSLKIKYHVQSCPFNFIWNFNKQTEHDFQKFILFPLFRIVQGLTQQNNELREIVRKKDVEIKQFKFEGAVLKRVTVATQPFDVSKFDEKFAETLELSKCMNQISELLKAQYSQMKTPLKAKVDKDENTTKTNEKEDLKLTPRRKRRKLIESRQQIIAEKLKACNKPFAYESSQSQISSISQSDTEMAPSTSRRILRSPRKRENIKIENDLNETKTTPTKRSSPEKPEVKRNLKNRFKFDDTSEEETQTVCNKNPVVKQTASTERADKEPAKPAPTTRSSASLKESPINASGFKTTSVSPKKNGGIMYEDSSESSTEEKPNKILNSLKFTKIKSPDDVQNLIDEWKALEKRRLADLKSQ